MTAPFLPIRKQTEGRPADAGPAGRPGREPSALLLAAAEKAVGVSKDTLLRMGAWYDSHAKRRRADEIDVKPCQFAWLLKTTLQFSRQE